MLLLLIPAAWLLYRMWKRPAPSVRISAVKPFSETMSKTGKRRISAIPMILFAAAALTLIVALAGPRRGIGEFTQRAEGIDIILAIDLSGSMRSIDVPDSVSSERELRSSLQSGKLKPRFEIAKEEIRKFIERRPNDRIGLVCFAPLPYTACPPTLDHAWLIANLDRLQPGVIGDKTGIAGPISSAVYRLKESKAKRRIVVLFTDGSNNVDAKVTPLQAAKIANTFDIVVYTVGIGSSRAFIQQGSMFGGSQFLPIQDQFDEKLLRDIAGTTSGKYYSAADADGLAKVMDEINKMEKTNFDQPRIIDYDELAPKLIIAALVMLLAGFLLEHTVFLRTP
jgi:Ca-activated chloride channel family protein